MRNFKAFTIIELLVLVSLVALLIAVLLPAIGKARDQAYITKSKSNLRQLAVAHATYAAAYNDQQWTNISHDVAQYGSELHSALVAVFQTGRLTNSDHWDTTTGLWSTSLGEANDNVYSIKSNFLAPPISLGQYGSSMESRYMGSFRAIQSRSFNQYVSGRYFDSTFYPPKDRLMIEAAGTCFDGAGEYCLVPNAAKGYLPPGESGASGVSMGSRLFAPYSSYVLSPAAMYNPEVFSLGPTFSEEDIWQIPAAFRSPTFSQARYPDLKTHMLEHHWLQHPARECNPSIALESSIGCSPTYFNAGIESIPVTLFYDGHIRMLSHREVIDADSKARATGGSIHAGLWHVGTPLAPIHYRSDFAYTPPGESIFRPSSFHILTRHGILGRDTIAR